MLDGCPRQRRATGDHRAIAGPDRRRQGPDGGPRRLRQARRRPRNGRQRREDPLCQSRGGGGRDDLSDEQGSQPESARLGARDRSSNGCGWIGSARSWRSSRTSSNTRSTAWTCGSSRPSSTRPTRRSNRRKVRAPIDGVIVELKRHRGEWVAAGDTLLRLLRMDRLRIEGFINAKDYVPGRSGRPPRDRHRHAGPRTGKRLSRAKSALSPRQSSPAAISASTPKSSTGRKTTNGCCGRDSMPT